MSAPRHLTLLLAAGAMALAAPALAADDLVLTPHGTLVAAADPPDGTPEATEAPAEAPAADAAYIYTARNLRDPFLLPAEVRAPETAREDVPPLERMPLSDFRLVAVVKKRGVNYAMVASTDGKGYTLGVGTRIGSDGGEIRRILPDAVIVEQVRADEFGELKKSETIIGLRPEEVVP